MSGCTLLTFQSYNSTICVYCSCVCAVCSNRVRLSAKEKQTREVLSADRQRRFKERAIRKEAELREKKERELRESIDPKYSDSEINKLLKEFDAKSREKLARDRSLRK